MFFTSAPARPLPRIVFLGAGRVASQLAPALANAGYPIIGVWSRTTAAAAALTHQLPGATVITDLAAIAGLGAEVVLAAVPDTAVEPVVKAANFAESTIIAHTAGSLPLLHYPHSGVFYPLQTFSPARPVDIRTIPLCLEATDDATRAVLTAMARSISDRVVWLDAAARANLHLAAVFASNFVNHLLGVSELILQTGTAPALAFDLLAPLVREVIDKAFTAPHGPFSVQTGPAVRNDASTLAAHRARLAANANLSPWLTVYDDITAAIQRVGALPPTTRQPMPDGANLPLQP